MRPDAFEDILPQELSKSETFWIQKDDSYFNQSVCERFWSDTFEIEDSTCNRKVFFNTGPVSNGRSWAKVDGPGRLNQGRSQRLKVDDLREWTVCESGRS